MRTTMLVAVALMVVGCGDARGAYCDAIRNRQPLSTAGAIGSPCGYATECAAGLTCGSTNTALSYGVCTRECTSVVDCPTGSYCVHETSGNRNVCLPPCNVTADCADGYVCEPHVLNEFGAPAMYGACRGTVCP